MGVALIIWKDALQMLGGDLNCVNYANPTEFEIMIPKQARDAKNTGS
jgi:hypothetical protein